MELYFFRHGDAEPASATVRDEERQLTERGRQETLAVGLALRQAGLQPEAILTSPLRRARQTAEILQEAFVIPAQVEPRLAPGCSLGDVQLLLSHHSRGRMMLVGHEPDFGHIVSQLIGGGQVTMAKSGVARVDCERVEPRAGVLVWLVGPEVVGGRG